MPVSCLDTWPHMCAPGRTLRPSAPPTMSQMHGGGQGAIRAGAWAGHEVSGGQGISGKREQLGSGRPWATRAMARGRRLIFLPLTGDSDHDFFHHCTVD